MLLNSPQDQNFWPFHNRATFSKCLVLQFEQRLPSYWSISALDFNEVKQITQNSSKWHIDDSEIQRIGLILLIAASFALHAEAFLEPGLRPIFLQKLCWLISRWRQHSCEIKRILVTDPKYTCVLCVYFTLRTTANHGSVLKKVSPMAPKWPSCSWVSDKSFGFSLDTKTVLEKNKGLIVCTEWP